MTHPWVGSGGYSTGEWWAKSAEVRINARAVVTDRDFGAEEGCVGRILDSCEAAEWPRKVGKQLHKDHHFNQKLFSSDLYPGEYSPSLCVVSCYLDHVDHGRGRSRMDGIDRTPVR